MIHAKSFPAAVAAADQVHLRILETTDLHVHVLPFDYFKDRPTPVLGLARAAGLVSALRADAANTLLFDNGDFLQGSPLGDYVAFSSGLGSGDLHPMIAAMNRLGYDAATVGNHEFNYGLDFMRNALARANFPVVVANVVGTAAGPGSTILPPWIILDRQVRDGGGRMHLLRVGVIGLLPPQTGIWDRDHLEGRVQFRDMVETAATLVPVIRQAGADIVVALAHTGIGESEAMPGMENAAIPLAQIEGLDALLMGHSHQVFPSAAFAGRPGIDATRGTIAGTPAVMAGCFGSHVGVIDLILERQCNCWKVTAATARATPIARPRANGVFVARAKSQPDILQAAAAAHVATRNYMARPVGASRVPLSTHLALVGDCTAVRVVAEAKADYIRKALAGGAFSDLPVLGAAAPFKAGGRGGALHYTDIPAGKLALRHMADLYPFPNQIRALHLTGAELIEWLERSASMYWQVEPGIPDLPLIDPSFPSYNFDMFSGISYVIDATRPARYDSRGVLLNPAARRVRDLTRGGLPIAAQDELIVVTNSYRVASIQLMYPGVAPRIVLVTRNMGRDVLMAWFAAGNRPETVKRSEGWQLSLPSGSSVIFDTSPRLQIGTGTLLRDLDLTDLGITATGYRRLRLSPKAGP